MAGTKKRPAGGGGEVSAMGEKTVYQVLPLEEGAWRIELAGDSVHELARSRSEAIARARELASRAPVGSVVVIGLDGRVEMEIDVAPRARPS